MNKQRFGVLLIILAAVSSVGLGVAWFGEGNRPAISDTPGRSLQKINDLLLIASTQAVANISVSNLSLNLTNAIPITNHPTVGFDVHATNITGTVTSTISPNPLPVVVTNTLPVPVTVTNASLAVNVTNASLTVAGTVTATVSPNPLPVVVTNSIPVPVTVTNTAVPVIGFTHVSTNYFTNASAAGVANYVAWAVTNTDAFRINGGSAILQSVTLINNTNRDYNIWIFPKVITAPTVDAAWTPTLADLQHARRTSTTNTTWALCGTNYVMTLSGIGLPMKNKDASASLHIIGTYMDTKAGYNTSGYIAVGLLQD